MIQGHRDLAAALLYDNEMWHQGESHYYIGALPKNFDYDPALQSLYDDLASKAIKTAARLRYQQVRGIHGAYTHDN